ncbi:ubiquitin conjugating protein [Arthrospira sp. O9.13F]|nr:ubiquitin conjugating protein [Arthrospira sp. O9.13F]
MNFQRTLRINTFLLKIPRKKLTRLSGLCYHLRNRYQGLPLSLCKNKGYNPDYIAR